MVRPHVVFPDPERLIVDQLAAVVAGMSPVPTVSVGVPTGWTPASPPHVQVAYDGTPAAQWPVTQLCVIRVVVRAATTSTAKALAGQVLALLLAADWLPGIAGIRYATGVLPARDPDTDAELASFTVEVNVRSQLAS